MNRQNDNPIIRRCVESRVSYPNALGTQVICDMLLERGTYDETLSKAAKKNGISEKEAADAISYLFEKRSFASSKEDYIRLLKEAVKTPRVCIVNFLKLLGFQEGTAGFDYLAMAVLDGDSKDSKCLTDVAEIFDLSVEEIQTEIESIVNDSDRTAGMNAEQAVMYLREKLITPTKNIKKALEQEGISDSERGFAYLATAAKFVMLGDKVNAICEYEVSSIYGEALSNVVGHIRYALRTQTDMSIYGFLKKVCYGGSEG